MRYIVNTICPFCGQPFPKQYYNQRYCSQKCRSLAAQKRKSAFNINKNILLSTTIDCNWSGATITIGESSMSTEFSSHAGSGLFNDKFEDITPELRIIGYMAVMNGAEFIEYAIRSTILNCDRFIVIEGAWGEHILANSKRRSDDGTLAILEKLQKEFPQLEVYYHNEASQLSQRTKVFDYLQNEPKDFWLWLIDHDEVYDTNNLCELDSHLRVTKAECLKINSYTFINDFRHYVQIGWPRLFRICANPGRSYYFNAPNHLTKIENGLPRPLVEDSIESSVSYYHYSYCHSAERFMAKRKERVLLHGQFKWQLDEHGKVVAYGTNIKEFPGDHPEIMGKHPLYKSTGV